MALSVHLHVCFACDDNEPVAEIAKKHLALLGKDVSDEAVDFLTTLSRRRGVNLGSKGGLSLWGRICDQLDGEEFVNDLTTFWKDLLSSPRSGRPYPFERVLVFTEREQSGQAIAFELFLDDDTTPQSFTVRRHECPFAWMVY